MPTAQTATLSPEAVAAAREAVEEFRAAGLSAPVNLTAAAAQPPAAPRRGASARRVSTR